MHNSDHLTTAEPRRKRPTSLYLPDQMVREVERRAEENRRSRSAEFQVLVEKALQDA